ncbi:arylsulfotransferase family protein [Halobaculum halobium]|uniref:arylsulfotransferase family protein n=1 Tax=Halobaculum halobium TaxID=3032281 RepID=UPI00361F0560
MANTRWHDADRINETHFAIADISQDRLIVVDITSDETVWEWRMDSAFDPATSGGDSDDWAHLNDVEILEDGTYMLSPRNHDQVIFVRPGEGLVRDRTLGADEEYDILYEQHNPDYLTGDGQTRSVLVADSQNNRIIEYERRNGSWVETWTWRDDGLRWPRDADRLPNGNTLVGDTGGDRIIEVTPSGEVVWGVRVDGNYEAERLGTGDESETGLPMSEIRGESDNEADNVNGAFFSPHIRLLINGLLFIIPPWVGAQTVVGVVLGAVAIFGEVIFELKRQLQVRRGMGL